METPTFSVTNLAVIRATFRFFLHLSVIHWLEQIVERSNMKRISPTLKTIRIN